MQNIRSTIKIIDKIFFFEFLKKFYNYIKFKIYKKKYFNVEDKFRFKTTILFNDNNNIISKLCETHGTDKGYINNYSNTFNWDRHAYSNFYFNLFNERRDDVKLVFEVGIGTNNPNLPRYNMGINYKPGSSLRVWKDYFKNAEIYGADLDKTILFNNEDKIHTFYVDQLDSGSIKKMWDNIGKTNFDIIIDDGLHTYDANLNFFLNSFDKLKKNGIYIIEDVQYHYLITIHDKLRQYNPNIILFDSKDFTRACFEGGTPQGFGENLIVFKKI